VLLAAAAVAAGAARAADPLQNAYGGEYTAASGDVVKVYTSALLPHDDTVNQQWADFLGSLVHGSELASVTLVIEPFGQVQQHCGLGAYGCYRNDTGVIVAIGERVPPDGPSPEGVVAHEYGHHIAQHRSNAPWNAQMWGTKRWASAMGICGDVRAGRLHPGNEAAYYLLNPAEAFAESYRILNEELLQLPVTPWRIVSTSLQPTTAALAALRKDVTEPWAAPAPRTIRGGFGVYGSDTRTYAVRTPYDGRLTATVAAPPGLKLRVSADGRASGAETICGTRIAHVTVTRLSGDGRFTLTVATP